MIVIVILLVGSGIFTRLVWLQVFHAEELRLLATSQYRSKITLEPYRGTIYDRSGRPLTANISDYYSIGINPYNVTEPDRLARDLSSVLGRSKEYYRKKLLRSNKFVILARKVEPTQFENLKNKGWKLIRQGEVHRAYPHNQIAGQLTGFTDIDNRGISGIELAHDELLKGTPGWRIVQLDVNGNQHIDSGYPYEPQVNGGDLVLTIDMAIQSILDEELSSAIRYYKAKSAAGLIIDPQTGEIIAMSSLPAFNPNNPEGYDISRQKNVPVTDLYEPGSTFKPIISSMLLEKGIYRPDYKVDCGVGYIVVHGKTIHDTHGYGVLSFADVLVKSSNVGMIKLTSDVKPQLIDEAIKNFGFLEPTGIDLPGEVRGSLPEVKDWSGLTKPNVVIGQGISVTMLQMAMAYSVFANGGVLMKPYLVREKRFSDGRVERYNPEKVRQVVSPETAGIISDILTQSVQRGTGKRVFNEDIPVAGKTGTAQLVNFQNGGYYQNRFAASFVGYFPATSPRYVILISMQDARGPSDEHTGGSTSAPVFKKVMERIVGLKPEIRNLVKQDTTIFKRDGVQVPQL